MLSRLTLVLGGASSGKTAFAEQLVLDHGKAPVYLATGQAFDDEMQAKIDAHRSSRDKRWHTIEAPLEAAKALKTLESEHSVLLDCATLWLSNQMLSERDVMDETNALCAALQGCAASVVIVSNEVGHGIVPEHRLGRQFRDAQGRLNQQLAALSEVAVLVVAGLPLVLKGKLP